MGIVNGIVYSENFEEQEKAKIQVSHDIYI